MIAETVATPIEQEVNGVDDMLYITSQSTGDGRLTINVIFKPGTNIDQAQVLVQNRVAVAQPRLPEDVRRLGVSVRKASPDLMMVVHMISPDGTRDQQYISNYATLYVKDVLTRIDGVGNVNVFGARDYSMRVWLDPARVAGRSLTAGEVVAALRAANLQVAAGAINQPPATSPGGFTLTVQTLGRLTSPEEFGDIVVAPSRTARWCGCATSPASSSARRTTRSTPISTTRPRRRSVIFQRPGLERARHRRRRSRRRWSELQKDFPPGVAYTVVYNPTEFIQASVDAVIQTLFEAVRAGRDRRHPVPADLAGRDHSDRRHPGVADRHVRRHGGGRHLVQHAVAVRAGAGDRHRRRRRHRRGRERRALPRARACRPKEAAHKTMDEVGGALIAISLVLIAVFLPTAFITGLQGTFYKQFAITIAASTAISAFVSLTLSPALAALLLKPHRRAREAPSTTLRVQATLPIAGSSPPSTGLRMACRTATAR